MKILSLLCVVAPVAAQFQLSLPPALQSLADSIQSLTDPSDTPKPAPAPAPTPTPKTTPTPTPKPAPPVQTSSTSTFSTETSSALSTSISTSSASSTSSTSSTSNTSSTSSTSTTTSATSTLAEAAATPTATGKQEEDSSGLSHGAKVGIGVGIGVFIIVGLLAAALYSFVRDRHSSEAYAAWRERRAKKHSRLGSSVTHTSFFRPREKEMELSQVEYGNGTILGGGKPAIYDMPPIPESAKSPSTSTQSLEKDLPAPPVAYQQAKQVQIKRKAVPGQPPPARKSAFKPRFSWMD